jgi:tetratricopeptide (TPR) repeat protein
VRASAPPPPPPAAPASSAPFLFELEETPAAPAPAEAAAEVSSELDFGELDLGGPPPSTAASAPPPLELASRSPVDDLIDIDDRSDLPITVVQKPAAISTVNCRSCGKPLTDPFDQAIGTCDDCRSAADASAPAPPPPPRIAPVMAPPVAAPVPAAASPSAPSAPAPVAASAPRRSSGVKSASREEESPGAGLPRQKIAIAAVAVLVLAAIGTVLAVKKPWRKKPPAFVQRMSSGAEKPIDRAVEAWRLRFVDDLAGSSADYLVAGEEELAKDTGAGYVEAEQKFQKALVLDKSSDRAIAGWVLALAFGRGSSIDDELARTAEDLLVAAEQRGAAGRVYSAHAHLLLARNGNMDIIKNMAERGKISPSNGDKAIAFLALGQAMVAKNPQYAAESFSQALTLDPKLKRAYLSQSQLLLTLGRYREAVADIEKRLELDPDQWEAADALARTWIEVGELAKAKKVYERVHAADPKSFRARLALAVFAYQHEGNLESAGAQFEALVADEKKLESKDLVEALGHRAASQRLAGNLAGALASTEKALALKAQDPHVNLQRFLIAIDQGNAADARTQWPSLAGKLGDPALEDVLEGELTLMEGNAAAAMKLFSSATEKDPRRIDALLLAGAAAAKSKNEGKAWEYVLKRGLKADPRSGGPLPVMARFFVRSSDLLKQARGAFEPLSKDAEDPNPPTAEGLVAWYANDFGAAEKFFSRATSFDTANGNGLAFRALLALHRKEVGNAIRLAGKAVSAERQLALSHYALGLALLTNNQPDLAKPEFSTAFAQEPTFGAARVRLAEIEAKQKKPEEARRLLSSLLLADPLYLDAKKALYALP